MLKNSYVNKWLSCVDFYYRDEFQTIDNLNLVHPDDQNYVLNNAIGHILKCSEVSDEWIFLDVGKSQIRIKVEAVKRVYPEAEFDISDLVTYESSKKGWVIGEIADLIWHDKDQEFKYYLSSNGKLEKRWLEPSRLAKFNLQELSKTISHALRHEPEEYKLKLLDQGWVLSSDLLVALSQVRSEWKNINISIVESMIKTSEKKRHEISGEFIRAKYGHTANVAINLPTSIPPDMLFHGTSRETVNIILKEGLKSMDRHYVHSSHLAEEAIRVGLRKDNKPTILKINTKAAIEAGVNFYVGNDKIWLSDDVPAVFIEIAT